MSKNSHSFIENLGPNQSQLSLEHNLDDTLRLERMNRLSLRSDFLNEDYLNLEKLGIISNQFLKYNKQNSHFESNES